MRLQGTALDTRPPPRRVTRGDRPDRARPAPPDTRIGDLAPKGPLGPRGLCSSVSGCIMEDQVLLRVPPRVAEPLRRYVNGEADVSVALEALGACARRWVRVQCATSAQPAQVAPAAVR